MPQTAPPMLSPFLSATCPLQTLLPRVRARLGSGPARSGRPLQFPAAAPTLARAQRSAKKSQSMTATSGPYFNETKREIHEHSHPASGRSRRNANPDQSLITSAMTSDSMICSGVLSMVFAVSSRIPAATTSIPATSRGRPSWKDARISAAGHGTSQFMEPRCSRATMQ